MDETLTAPETAPDPFEQPAEPALQVVPVEFVIDSHRFTADIQHPGTPRRLVDYLNSVDGPRIGIYNGSFGDGHSDTAASRFQLGQIYRDAILIAIPRGNTTFTARSMEVVPKRPIPAMLVLPGYDVAGNIYMVPEIDPANTPLIGNRNFMPLTDALITPAAAPDRAWREPLIVVNIARTLFYAPKP